MPAINSPRGVVPAYIQENTIAPTTSRFASIAITQSPDGLNPGTTSRWPNLVNTGSGLSLEVFLRVAGNQAHLLPAVHCGIEAERRREDDGQHEARRLGGQCPRKEHCRGNPCRRPANHRGPLRVPPS